MSGAYTLFHVFNELLDEKANKNSTARGKTMGAKSEIYQGSWSALNAWIETKLAKQKGAGISGFGCFAWELKQKGETTQCRPIFIISDAFVKNFRVKRDRIHRLPETTAVEEVNYSLLAIKFSNSLTKDMVFSGLRDTIKKIGDFIDRGYEIEIPFTFGTLTAKERRVKFEFSQSRLQEILPERIEFGTLGFGKAPAHLFDETESEAGNMSYRGSEVDVAHDEGSGTNRTDTMLANTARRVGTTPGVTGVGGLKKNNNRPSHIPSLLSATMDDEDDEDATAFLDNVDQANNEEENESMRIGIAAVQKALSNQKIPSLPMNKIPNIPTATSTISALPVPESQSDIMSGRSETFDFQNTSINPPEDLKELLTTLTKKTTKAAKEEFRNQAKNRVLEQAYLRCLNAVEQGAYKDDITTLEARKLLDDWKQNTKFMRMKKYNDSQDLKKSLDLQINYNTKKAEETKNDQKNYMAAFILPTDDKKITPAALALSSYDKNGNLISSRHVVSKLLEEQIIKNAENKEKERQKLLHSERNYLNRLSTEIELHNAMDRSMHLEKQRSLLEAWERDGHIRNLKKLQPFGVEPVQDYIQRNLTSDPYATSTGPLNYTNTMPSKSSFSNNNHNSTAPSANNSSMMLKTSSDLNKSSTLANKLNMSIGYDPRKPKLEW